MAAPKYGLPRSKIAAGRSPAARAAAGRVAPRDAMWAEVRALRTFGTKEIAAAGNVDRNAARVFLAGLAAAGIVRIEPPAADTAKRLAIRYELLRDPGPVTPRVGLDGQPVLQGNLRAAAWRAMRSLKVFTVRDLHVTSGISEVDGRSYLHFLTQAGYVRYRTKGVASAPSVYQFVESRFTGPKPPQVMNVKAVYDPNVAKVVWPLADQVEEGDEA